MDRELPRVTGILQAEGLIDFSRVPDRIMKPAQEFGTAFHLARHLFDKGTLDEQSLSDPLKPYLAGYKLFKKDFGFKVSISESEQQFISEKYGFKGTPDLWPVIKGKRTLIDTKTSTNMYPATAIQTAAYQILLEEAGIKIQARWGVKFSENGLYKIEPYTKLSDKTTFLSALNVYNWKKENL
jgi:hypothetical protein